MSDRETGCCRYTHILYSDCAPTDFVYNFRNPYVRGPFVRGSAVLASYSPLYLSKDHVVGQEYVMDRWRYIVM